MNPDMLYDRYLAQLQQAMNVDEQASAAQQRGEYLQAAQRYEEAAARYSLAAQTLLEVGEISSASEQGSIEISVDRLIAISQDLKQHAKNLRENPPAPSAASPIQPLPTDEGEGAAAFTPAKTPGVTFDEIAGLEDAKQLILDEIIHPILHRELYQRFHVESNGGLLLFGPPGSGKTMMARAIANQANMAFFSVRCSDIVGKYFGEAEKHVQSLFNAAREAKNAVIFLDEAEALACRRGGNSTVMNRLVPELLSQMDGFERFDGHIIVVFATNRPYDIDPAFLRPGRLPNHCYIPLPDLAVRRQFLQSLIENRPCDGPIDVDALARNTERFSCADLVNLIKRGCQHPINRTILRKRAGEKEPTEFLTQQDLTDALSTLHPSVEPEEIQRLEKWMKKIGMKLPNAA